MLHLIGALWVPWIWLGNPDGRIWIQRIISEPEFSASELADHPARVEALNIQAVLLAGDDHKRRDELFEQAAALAQRIGDDRRVVIINFGRGEFSLVPGKGAQARLFFEAALAGCEGLGLPDAVGWSHDHLGWAALVDGEYDLAREHFEQAVEVARSDPLGEWVKPHALAALGPLIARTGDKQRAVRLAEEAIEAARGLPARPVLAMALSRAADTAVFAGEPRRAASFLVELLAVLSDLGTQRWPADALETAAVVLADRDPDRAAVILAVSDRLREAAREPRGGVRVIAEEVRQARDRLIKALGADRFALHDNRSRELAPNEAVTLAVAALNVVCGPDIHHS